MPKLNKSFINSLKVSDADKVYWDDDLTGFGLRVQGNSKSWILMYRNTEGRQRKLTLAKINKLTPEEARKEAKSRLAEVVHGEDPAQRKIVSRNAMTVAELCDFYLQEGCENKKDSTKILDVSRVERHIKPLIGHLAVISLTSPILEKMMHDVARGKTAQETKSDKPRGKVVVKGGRGTATRTIGLFGSILEFARRQNIIEHNPARSVKKFKDNKKNIFLDLKEITLLGEALIEAEKRGKNKVCLNAIKLLLLTGCRKTEVLALKWEYVDFENKCFRFPDTKTGSQIRPFGESALRLLKSMNKEANSEWVFPSSIHGTHIVGLSKLFKKVTEAINTKTNKRFLDKNLSLHTLRHSFASVAANMGFTELTIAGLLGHRLGGVTNRYSHNVDSALIKSADDVSTKIEKALRGMLNEG